MEFVYAPEGADPIRWPFEPRRLMSAEAEAIERLTRLTFPEWQDQVTRGAMLATRALLYVLLKRDRPTLKFEDVDICAADVAIVYDDAESARMLVVLDEAAATRELTEGEDQVRELLRASAPAVVDEPAPADEPEPVDPDKPSPEPDPKEG